MYEINGNKAFETEEEAEREGFYWEGSIERWLKL